jgi:hypothetical protein
MGVELLEQPQKYLKHIQRLRLALKNRTHPHKLENVEVP